MAKAVNPDAKYSPVRVRLATRRKLDRIAKLNRWKLGETIDALSDFYLDRNRGASVAQSAQQPA